ncbi:hypothetical protein IKU74_06920 [bacterium]|nr:hypothetical protein [bacterium]
MADLLSISSIRERIFNPTKHEKTVARTSNPFAQTSFKGNVLTADVFVSENAKEKQANAINFTGKLKASALVGSISDFGNKIKAGIESAVNFAKRIAEYPINFWNKLSETEVTFEPAIKAMSKAGEKFGEALKMDASVVGAKAGEVLKMDVGAKVGEALHTIFDNGISAKQISKMEDISIPRQLLMDNVQAWEASLAS